LIFAIVFLTNFAFKFNFSVSRYLAAVLALNKPVETFTSP